MTSSSCGTGTTHWSASITNCTLRCASRKAESRARQRPLSNRQTAERPAKRGTSLDPLDYDAGKEIKNRKRHILVTRWAFC